MGKEILSNYFKRIIDLLSPEEEIINSLLSVKDVIKKIRGTDKKIIIVGNGGSAAIASHISVDLTKNAGVRCLNFNEASLLTCFSNDYGYENWVEKAVQFYGDEGDILIAISSSGNSKNILNGCKSARLKNFSNIITLSGFEMNNPLSKVGDINLWVNSNLYNYVENIHQIWLLSIVDLIIQENDLSVEGLL